MRPIRLTYAGWPKSNMRTGARPDLYCLHLMRRGPMDRVLYAAFPKGPCTAELRAITEEKHVRGNIYDAPACAGLHRHIRCKMSALSLEDLLQQTFTGDAVMSINLGAWRTSTGFKNQSVQGLADVSTSDISHCTTALPVPRVAFQNNGVMPPSMDVAYTVATNMRLRLMTRNTSTLENPT